MSIHVDIVDVPLGNCEPWEKKCTCLGCPCFFNKGASTWIKQWIIAHGLWMSKMFNCKLLTCIPRGESGFKFLLVWELLQKNVMGLII